MTKTVQLGLHMDPASDFDGSDKLITRPPLSGTRDWFWPHSGGSGLSW